MLFVFYFYYCIVDLEWVWVSLGGGFIVVIGVIVNWIGKRWLVEWYVEFIICFFVIGVFFLEVRFFILGVLDEKEMVVLLVFVLFREWVINKIGKLILMDVFLYVKCVCVFVGNDFGFMYLVVVVGVLILGLFGLINEKWYVLWGL